MKYFNFDKKLRFFFYVQNRLNKGLSKKDKFLILYYIANKQPDAVWIQHPTISVDAYLGPSFSKKYLPRIPRDIITRDERQVGGTSRYKVNPEFLP